MTPEASASVRIEVAPEPIRSMPRLGKGVCWSLLVAEMAEDAGGSETGGNAPNPWTPTDPKEAA